jgi:hypothetical protein
MHRQQVVAGAELGCHLLGQLGRKPAFAVDLHQLRAFALRIAGQLALLEREVGALGVGLRADRDILPAAIDAAPATSPRSPR